MVEGKNITLGGELFMLPPIPLSGLTKIGGRINSIGSESPESVDALVDAIHASLRRNYSEIERDFVDLNIDALNFADVLAAFVEVNKFDKAEKSEKPKARKSTGAK